MVVGSDFLKYLYEIGPNQYSGVVYLTHEGKLGSGVLLYDGRSILTAAHLFFSEVFNTIVVNEDNIDVHFRTDTNTISKEVSHVYIHPLYNPTSIGQEINYDLAIVTLEEPAPYWFQRYDIYRSYDEIGKTFEFVGYGLTGSGYWGYYEDYTNTEHTALRAFNSFDVSNSVFDNYINILNLESVEDSVLLADFDDGTKQHDALGRLLGIEDLGLGIFEGMIALGDSGGPAFIDSKVAGIANSVGSVSLGSIRPDVDNVTNSSFGEIGAWIRVSFFQEWIDKTLRSNYKDAPKTPDEVKKQVIEGDYGITYVYFLVQFTGIRKYPDEVVSVDYATKDGTAKAYQDYIPVSGTLKIYPDENYAVIPVEIIGDNIIEPDEYFYLSIFNPVGGSFGPGVSELTAMRTIINDDYWA